MDTQEEHDYGALVSSSRSRWEDRGGGERARNEERGSSVKGQGTNKVAKQGKERNRGKSKDTKMERARKGQRGREEKMKIKINHGQIDIRDRGNYSI